jgi:hypothetical protein
LTNKQKRKLIRLGDEAFIAVERYGRYAQKCKLADDAAVLRAGGFSRSEAKQYARRMQASMRPQPARVPPAETRWLQ